MTYVETLVIVAVVGIVLSVAVPRGEEDVAGAADVASLAIERDANQANQIAVILGQQTVYRPVYSPPALVTRGHHYDDTNCPCCCTNPVCGMDMQPDSN